MKYEKESVAGEFIKMLKKLNEINQPAFTPSSFKDAFKKHVGIQKNFNVDDQQDSQEFLTVLFNELHNDLKMENDGILSEERSIIKDTFEMTVRQKILCRSCLNENDSRKTEYILLAPLPAEDDISLANCLKKYFEEQPLDNTNCAVDGCGSQSRTIILEPLELPPRIKDE
ncbi:putative ubiquitin carboxyl-terminal hydrolase 50 [Aphidius gifuensis]|uniref:putative ubiquitin carboxyl-terminal hydrolase 50 n=1 Tax=Aphidius gifuensis TaxID=684658 RepID=UPI001CDC1455|nr:putative ubiquitin carboxyl-terminal hydrolase 50 [Aphidius gifuensis]